MRDNDTDADVEFDAEQSVQDIEIDASEGNFQEKIKELRSKLSASEKEKQEYLTGWQRTKADFVNVSRRREEELSALHKFASESLIEELIPVLDSFDSALQSKDTGQWREGFERIHGQLMGVLKARGLELIENISVPMDPRLHEAIQLTPSTAEHPPNTVAEVLQKGYKLHDKVLRAAKVIVTE